MKKLVLAIMAASMLMFAGCDSHDAHKCYENVAEKYPNSRIVPVIGNKFLFIVIEKDRVIYVRTMNQMDAEISSEQVIKLNK